jgi:hypothetical protein
MTDTMMLLAALVAFAMLIVGWMILPDTPQAPEMSSTAVPQPARAS